MSEGGRPKGCFKKGCFGCLGCLGISLLAGGALALIAVVQANDPAEMVPETFERDVPGEYRALSPSELERSPEFAGTDVDRRSGVPGVIDLDVSHVRFRIEPAPPGAPLRIEAEYDPDHTRIEEELEPSRRGGEPWRFNVTAKSRRFVQLAFNSNTAPEVVLHVPRDLPFALEGRVATGETRIELGGLDVREVDLDAGVGDHRISFSEPTPYAIDRLRIDGSIGELRVDGIGNASPARVVVRQNIGAAGLGLDGAWRNDSEIVLSSQIGELWASLPGDEVRIQLDRASIGIGERRIRALEQRAEPPPGAPTLRLNLSHTLGEVSLR